MTGNVVTQSKVFFFISHAYMVQSAILSLQALVMRFVQMGIAACHGNSQLSMEGKAARRTGKYEGLRKPQLCMIYFEHVFSTVLTAIGRTAVLHKPQGKSISCQAKQTAHIQNLTG